MSGRTLEVFCDDARYPAMTDAQLSECIATIRAFSQGQPVRLESESWFGNFRRLLPMYWKYKQDAEYWKSWQDPDKIKRLEAENADLLAIAQGQKEELERLRFNASTAAFDKVNDQLREANRENKELQKQIQEWQSEHPFPG